MSKLTKIQWCHSSVNIAMGCDGCELWSKKVKACYAGSQTAGYAGQKGWPSSFDNPTLFLDRLEPALQWGPPTDKERDAKPWMPRDYPRVIFLNDMGDTFTESLPLNWLAPVLERIKSSNHIWMILTKRPSRMYEFSQRFPFPKNVWLGTSVTTAGTSGRVDILKKVCGGGLYFVSFEPMLTYVPEAALNGIQWAIFGGESDQRTTKARPCNTDWIIEALAAAKRKGAKSFVKQLGSNPVYTAAGISSTGDGRDNVRAMMHDEKNFIPWNSSHNAAPKITDGHGGDWNEWCEQFRVREFPTMVPTNTQQAML